MKKWQKRILIGCGACLVLVGVEGAAGFPVLRHVGHAIKAGAERFLGLEQPWVACGVPHPGATPGLTFMQKGIHPYLAEYEYMVRFEDGTNSVERWLYLHLSGRTRINAYWYPQEKDSGPSIRLQDDKCENLLRMDTQETYLILRCHDRVYVGEITESNPRIIALSELQRLCGAPEIRNAVGPNTAIDITGTPAGGGPGQYFGRLEETGDQIRFVPAAESPEEQCDSDS
jgi:hypothetical protein